MHAETATVKGLIVDEELVVMKLDLTKSDLDSVHIQLLIRANIVQPKLE